MPLQVVCLISQSIVLGYLTEYFGINEPTSEETRNAYLYAAGKLAIFNLKVSISFQEGEGICLSNDKLLAPPPPSTIIYLISTTN